MTWLPPRCRCANQPRIAARDQKRPGFFYGPRATPPTRPRIPVSRLGEWGRVQIRRSVPRCGQTRVPTKIQTGRRGWARRDEAGAQTFLAHASTPGAPGVHSGRILTGAWSAFPQARPVDVARPKGLEPLTF